MAFRQKGNPGRDAAQEPAGIEQGNARLGQGKNEDGTTGEKDHSRYQETGQGGTNGCCEDHGQGSGANATIHEEVYADEGQHTGSVAKNSDSQVPEHNG